jgi:putative protease
MRHPKPEIMSPVGYWPQLHAAIEAGADAVYFGLTQFTARAKVGFTVEELPEVMRTLHQRGVRGYVTFNTLVFDNELRDAANALAEIADAGVDAIIVQDFGIAKLARQISPDLEVHGSTQMSITSAEGVAHAQQLGATRVVLGRELSLDDMRAIRAKTDCELEIFAHGALCVSYSGQCFSSEAWGGRSANRGQCAQACRLPYEMIVDGEQRPLGDARYLLSPGDLYALPLVPEIVKIGISALKIEGRYKDADYVALTTKAYRQAVDEAWADLPLSITPAEELQLEQVYSRGLGTYFIGGINHQQVVKGRAPRHRGVLAGRVSQVLDNAVLIVPDERIAVAPLKPGDGLVFDAASWRSPEEREEGGRVYEVRDVGSRQLELRFGHGAVNTARIRTGDLVWRTHDPDLDKVVRPYIDSNAPVSKQMVNVRAVAHEGEPLELEWTLERDPEVRAVVRSELVLQPAQQRTINEEYLREQLGRLGNTAYALGTIELDVQGTPFMPSSQLNKLRRLATDLLTEQQNHFPYREINDPDKALNAMLQPKPQAQPETLPAELHILVRTPEQLDAAIELRPSSITLDYLELYGLKPAVERVQAAGITVRVASPRILKPSEQNIVRFLLKLNCEIVVRSSGLLHALLQEEHPKLIGDFSLNTANVLTAQDFLGMGISRLSPSHDLNAEQVMVLGQELGSEALEVIAYQHLPVFHTEHCVFCRFLSDGTSFKDCGHPCEKHRVALRDRNGRAHPVMADVGCRNTVFGAQAQEASRHIDSWLKAGIRHYRLEFVHESAEQVLEVGRAFAETLAGKRSSQDLNRTLRRVAPQGSTEGSLFVPDGHFTIPLVS